MLYEHVIPADYQHDKTFVNATGFILHKIMNIILLYNGIMLIQGDMHHRERSWKWKVVCCKLYKESDFTPFNQKDYARNIL